jgi:nucleoside-diphosphate kinase
MSGNITFTMIKPEAVSDGYSGPITEKIEAAGFEIIAMKMTRLSIEKAGDFYMVHKDRPFYSSLCDYMSSGKIIAMVLKKDNAVEDYRKLIGATDPEKAEEGTIRKLFARSLQSNAVHGSDSDENAKIEAGFFFSELELFDN